MMIDRHLVVVYYWPHRMQSTRIRRIATVFVGQKCMKEKTTVLTREERDVLILAALRGHHLNNAEIAQLLGVSLSRVKKLLYRACLKLEAHNTIEAVTSAIKRGEINLNELYTPEEIAEMYSSFGHGILRHIRHLTRREAEHGDLPGEDERTIPADRRQDTLLTNRERDIIISVGRGLTNKEIADTLCISEASVRTFLYRACLKLGARSRSDASQLAVKRGEISIGDMHSLDELLGCLVPLGVEFREKIAELISQKLEQEPVATDG